ncbi:glycoside hydrolase family 16 protein [Zasmidium cellare ATCC 36951]|uniref:Glycoside hydrolase family 16 protein n=1 Tax=Zasmidium cellare ATCC 36951 TaxID=1080233 RepID=A0A6A6CKA5_ZASCE|nr:glycoside hydrolase family 16 protein [Zasmidium cellare ATCC 36951]KAF2166638.1 glycoside hydrolase family 16 protein [Zasmidium cellare ATCC 36951]
MRTTLCLVVLLRIFLQQAGAQETYCSCGFLDPDTNSIYTDTLIAYFNETSSIDSTIFAAQDFAHRTQHGWNTIFREGAKPQNVRLSNDSGVWHANQSANFEVPALELITDPGTADHVVYGGKLQTLRRDIQFGSFRASMKSVAPGAGGTALTMGVAYNASQGLQVDFLNMDHRRDAYATNLVNGEWPSFDDNSTTNYTEINSTGINPWASFVDVRMDWNETNVDFWINNVRTRSATKDDRSVPAAGTALELKSWSTGDKTYMEGPPSGNATRGHVLYVRAFFNSSTMTANDHKTYDDRCTGLPRCLTSDITLRNSSYYSPASTVKWEQHFDRSAIRTLAGIVAAACSTLGVLALVNVFMRRSPLRKIYRTLFKRNSKGSVSSESRSSEELRVPSGEHSQGPDSGYATPLPGYSSGTQTPAPAYASQTALVSAAEVSSSSGLHHTSSAAELKDVGSLGSLRSRANGTDEVSVLPRIPERDSMVVEPASQVVRHSTLDEKGQTSLSVTEKGKGISAQVFSVPSDPLTEKLPPVMEHIHLPVKPEDKVEPVTGAVVATLPANAAPKKRIDYLAGLVAVACIGVTLRHFCQTFWPWIINGYGSTAHWPKVEKWANIFIGAFAITQLWIGPFFLTATRFLSTNYLKNGNLEDIAKKLLRRGPRLFVPIIIIYTLEYFLMEMGLTTALQLLPSVGYSTWPYVVPAPNFGVYLNDLFQLAYLMPNAIPEVVSHYCIGVLWTVPIQLQFTYVVLIGAVLVRSVKTPWKRACFYAFIITCGWYARSWSACHWCGLALSDLDATFKWKKYLESHKVVKYLIMTAAFVGAAGAPLAAVFNGDWSFDTRENSIHPDFETGLPIVQARGVEYPDYYIPTFTILAFSIGLQILVELSTWVQAFLSIKMILWLHPHIMTVYLFHGFIFWAFGSAVCVGLWKVGLPYWACLLLTLILSYTVLFLVASVLTPLMAVPTDASMRFLDRWTKEDPVPKVSTIMPYHKTLILDREGVEAKARDDRVAEDEKAA